MLKDIYPSLDDEVITSHTQYVLRNQPNGTMTLADFMKMMPVLQTKLIYLCRSPKSIVSQIVNTLSNRNNERVRTSHNKDAVLRAKRATKGTCMACRPQQYEYGNHCITLDTAGRCVEPKIISQG